MKICPKCNKDWSDTTTYCGDCGFLLVGKINTDGTIKEGTDSYVNFKIRKIISVSLVFAFFVFMVFVAPFFNIFSGGQSPYNEIICFMGIFWILFTFFGGLASLVGCMVLIPSVIFFDSYLPISFLSSILIISLLYFFFEFFNNKRAKRLNFKTVNPSVPIIDENSQNLIGKVNNETITNNDRIGRSVGFVVTFILTDILLMFLSQVYVASVMNTHTHDHAGFGMMIVMMQFVAVPVALIWAIIYPFTKKGYVFLYFGLVPVVLLYGILICSDMYPF
jgi:hypothetical protein